MARKSFDDFYREGGYADTYWGDDFAYGLNPVNWFSGDVDSNSPSKKRARVDYEAYLNNAFNIDFQELYDSGASSDDLMKYVLANSGDPYNADIVNSMINMRASDESYARNIKNMKEAGINPLVGMGNVGALGGNPDISLDNSVAQAQVGTRGYNSDLANIKNILLILLALGKLAA